jgi:hypothetical protein
MGATELGPAPADASTSVVQSVAFSTSTRGKPKFVVIDNEDKE